MKPGEFIGSGYRCDVYAWGVDRVVKLFKPGANRGWIENEAAVSRLVHRAGLPTPAVGDIVEVDGRTGIIYERIRGPLLASEVLSHPERAGVFAREMAELHARMHSHVIPDLPSQRTGLERAISSESALASEMKEAVLAVLFRLPDGDSVCHGDLNLNNIILSSGGMVVIDWDNAKRGNPIADVARTVLMLNNSGCHFADPSMKALVAELAADFRDEYLTGYFEVAGGNPGVVEAWMVPVAAARISEKVAAEQDALVEVVRRGLAKR